MRQRRAELVQAKITLTRKSLTAPTHILTGLASLVVVSRATGVTPDAVVLATKDEHRFFTDEANLIRDIRRVPIRYAGNSISYKRGGRKKDGSRDDKWHAHVAMDRERYLGLRASFSERALRESSASLAKAFYGLPVAPYAPVRRQLLMTLRAVNRIRKVARRSMLPSEILPLRRRVVKPFSEVSRDVVGPENDVP